MNYGKNNDVDVEFVVKSARHFHTNATTKLIYVRLDLDAHGWVRFKNDTDHPVKAATMELKDVDVYFSLENVGLLIQPKIKSVEVG